MKGQKKELLFILLIVVAYYITPLFYKQLGDSMNLLIINLAITFVLSIVLGLVAKYEYKFLYPLVIAVLYMPSVYIFPETTTLTNSFWIFVAAMTGMGFGTSILLLK